MSDTTINVDFQETNLNIDFQETSLNINFDSVYTGNSIGLDKYYEFEQSAFLNTWLIFHNLNKKPAVFCENEFGIEIRGEITHIDRNTLQIVFSLPVSGKVYLN
jgi:hypothetical protein